MACPDLTLKYTLLHLWSFFRIRQRVAAKEERAAKVRQQMKIIQQSNSFSIDILIIHIMCKLWNEAIVTSLIQSLTALLVTLLILHMRMLPECVILVILQ